MTALKAVAAHSNFVRLLRVLLPHGGSAVVTVEAYFDESESKSGAPFLCVAGYVFDADRAADFDREWRQMLDDVDLPYFHMTACEARAEPFEHLEYEIRVAIQRRATGIINKNVSHGVVVSVDPESYIRLTPRHPLIAREPYTFCVYGCFMAVRQRLNKEQYNGTVAYFFEAGQEHQKETDRLMREYMSAPDSDDVFRYQSHAFVKKRDSTLLQAADLLAWHCLTNYQRTKRGDYSRPDFVDMIDDRYWLWHYDEAGIREHAEIANRAIAAYPGAGAEPTA